MADSSAESTFPFLTQPQLDKDAVQLKAELEIQALREQNAMAHCSAQSFRALMQERAEEHSRRLQEIDQQAEREQALIQVNINRDAAKFKAERKMQAAWEQNFKAESAKTWEQNFWMKQGSAFCQNLKNKQALIKAYSDRPAVERKAELEIQGFEEKKSMASGTEQSFQALMNQRAQEHSDHLQEIDQRALKEQALIHRQFNRDAARLTAERARQAAWEQTQTADAESCELQASFEIAKAHARAQDRRRIGNEVAWRSGTGNKLESLPPNFVVDTQAHNRKQFGLKRQWLKTGFLHTN
mmetsp:Transcript_72392/g.125508  ORF Transcript_72392/g.125508 Transcript_72392/m.125508 type:complete len:298 (+) Transcript_72392:55-948(+)